MGREEEEEEEEVFSAICPDPQPPEVLRDWDRRAIDDYGIPGVVLMENAGGGVARLLIRLLRTDPRIKTPFHVLCGPGNNGGDGFVIARHLHNHGVDVTVTVVGTEPYRPGSDAAINFEIMENMEIPLRRTRKAPTNQIGNGTCVDALFGTGLSRPLTTPYREWVEMIDACPSAVVSVDTPSGLDASTGEILGVAPNAMHTVTFAASKTGFTTPNGKTLCGSIHVMDIGIPRGIWETRSARKCR